MNSRSLVITAMTAWALISLPVQADDLVGAFHAAVRASDVARIDALLAEQPSLVNAADRHRGSTPLHMAIRCLQVATAERLVAAGANLNARDKFGSAALHVTVTAGWPTADMQPRREAMTKFLIKSGVDVRVVDNQGLTPLHLVAMKGRSEMLEPLLGAKAEIKAKDQQGRTPLHYAALYNQKDIAERLISKGADVRATDHAGNTPLHEAARRFRQEVTRVLLAHGADVNAKNTAGETALLVGAAHAPKEPEVDVLVTAVATLLLDNGADVNATDKAGFTPLHYAVAQDRPKLAALLKQRGGK